MYSSYCQGYADGYLAAKNKYDTHNNQLVMWERVAEKAREQEQKNIVDLEEDEAEYRRRWNNAYDDDSSSDYDPRPLSRQPPKPENYTRNPYDESDDSDDEPGCFVFVSPRWGMMHNLPIKNAKIYRTFEASDFKDAKDMIPHISEVSQWSRVVTMDDFDTSDYEQVLDREGYPEWVLKDNAEQLRKENMNICVRTREKRDMKPLPKVGTHEERKRTKKDLLYKKMANRKTIRSSKKNNRRLECTVEEIIFSDGENDEEEEN